ncbi:hypothetical protein BDA96_01G421800 [Sorghum bicolor]|uniref:Uncharacterized protein n=2 Tax=Sorghum bicolor TaxID=4558 RepID=A0A1Z5S9V1_SORBI|nr:hypothetical protein BDA96_01G421800 [Sorghum bicolor]OQU92720.1 hypothetical protein SORBI_3001G396550 [Sorghum bicolor]
MVCPACLVSPPSFLFAAATWSLADTVVFYFAVATWSLMVLVLYFAAATWSLADSVIFCFAPTTWSLADLPVDALPPWLNPPSVGDHCVDVFSFVGIVSWCFVVGSLLPSCILAICLCL